MNPFRTLLLCVTTLLLTTASLDAQVRQKISPPEWERATVTDESGLKQFPPLEADCEPCHGRGENTCQGCGGQVENPRCTECKGSKKARCRPCAGTKKVIDPLLEMHCNYCNASGWYDCAQCAGFGVFFVTSQDGGRVATECGACKKKGRYPCVVCDGKGKHATIRIKKKKLPTEAKLADLRAIHEELTACLVDMEAFEPKSRASKSMDALEDIVKKPGKKVPELKDMLEMLETALKGLTKAAAAYEGYEAKKTHQFLLMKDRNVYLLQHNLRVLDLCIARAEHNEAADGKGK